MPWDKHVRVRAAGRPARGVEVGARERLPVGLADVRKRRVAATSEVLKWARANVCPWDEWTCAYAAGGGHLETLKWVRANGCPWDELTCELAVSKGYVET